MIELVRRYNELLEKRYRESIQVAQGITEVGVVNMEPVEREKGIHIAEGVSPAEEDKEIGVESKVGDSKEDVVAELTSNGSSIRMYAVLLDSDEVILIHRRSEEMSLVFQDKTVKKVRRVHSEEEFNKYKRNKDLFNKHIETPEVERITYSDFNTYAYAYVDGSYNYKEDRYGYGGFIDNGVTRYIITGNGINKELSKYKSLTGEYLGVFAVLNKALELRLRGIIIYTDFSSIVDCVNMGIKNSPFSKDLLSLIEKLKSEGVDVVVQKVKAHSGIIGNEIVDRIARSEAGLEKKTSIPVSFFKPQINRSMLRYYDIVKK